MVKKTEQKVSNTKPDILQQQDVSPLFFIVGEVNHEMLAAFMEWICQAHLPNDDGVVSTAPINLVVHSDGGDLTCAFTIVDAIRGSLRPVHVFGTGSVASAALVILSAGDYRIVTKSTSVMSHSYSWGVEGKHHELVSAGVEGRNVYNRMIDHFHEFTKLSASKIEKELLGQRDHWMSAEEAKALKLCDDVIDFLPIANFIPPLVAEKFLKN